MSFFSGQHSRRALPEDGKLEPIKGLRLARSSQNGEPVYGVSEPTFCIIAQGSKEIFLGGHRSQYDPYSYLLATAELPIMSRILAASTEKPYLGLLIIIDPAVVGSVMVEMGQLPPRSQAPARAIEVSPLNASLLDATVRLVRLLDSPEEARLRFPLISREIIYRVGYDDASHFNRDYKRFFGDPPMRDLEPLREAAEASSNI